MIDRLQSLQGTVWQDRLLYLQQNAEVGQWIFVGILVVFHLLISLLILRVCRKSISMNVGALCFIPCINVLVLVVGVIKSIFGAIFEVLSKSREKKEKKKKSVKSKSKDVTPEVSVDDEEIDLF